MHLLSVAYLTDSSPIVKAVAGRLTTIYQLRVENIAELETF